MCRSEGLLVRKRLWHAPLQVCLGLVLLLAPSVAGASHTDCVFGGRADVEGHATGVGGRCPDLVVYQIATPNGLIPGWENSILVQVRNQTDIPTRNAAKVRIITKFDVGEPKMYIKQIGTVGAN
jgi:hypothetical protein